MEGKLLLKVVLLVSKSKQKPNLTYSNVTECNKKIFGGQKIKANKKIIIGQREEFLIIFKSGLP